MKRNVSKKRFVRYKEGAELYSMCQRKFQQMAKDANAIYKVDKLVLVNCDIFEELIFCLAKSIMVIVMNGGAYRWQNWDGRKRSSLNGSR